MTTEGAYISSLVLVHTQVSHLLGSMHQDVLETASKRAGRVYAAKKISSV